MLGKLYHDMIYERIGFGQNKAVLKQGAGHGERLCRFFLPGGVMVIGLGFDADRDHGVGKVGGGNVRIRKTQ